MKIYFDMDGVLADFERGVRELTGLSSPEAGKRRTYEEDEAMWVKIRGTDHFYDRLEPVSGALEMFRRLYDKYGDGCEILTGIPKPRRGILTVAEDKKNWAARMLSADLKVNLVYREEKKNYCSGKESILIDDLPVNIREWEEAGGRGILFTDVPSAIRELEQMDIL